MAKKRSKAEQKKMNWLRKRDHRRASQLQISSTIPPSSCSHCRSWGGTEANDPDDNFDENGYPIPKRSLATHSVQLQRAICSVTRTLPMIKSLEVTPPPKLDAKQAHFRLLDLPPELRLRIYEYAVYTSRQPVCIPDHLLRPSDDLAISSYVLRECTRDTLCLPCQLHDFLGTGNVSLSRATRQLHAETALVTYAVNAFSVHNLYYLQTFLKIIGFEGRQHLRSLRFDWRLPEEEAQALGIFTDVQTAYSLLVECKALIRLDVDLHAINLLLWRGNGNPRSVKLDYLNDLPHVDLMFGLRGLKDIRVGWELGDGLLGMEQWVLGLIGYWRLGHGQGSEAFEPVKAGIGGDPQTGWRYAHWKAAVAETEEDITR